MAAKAAHEDALLAKFAALINAKKLKIRDLQSVLAAAVVDERRAGEVAAARSAEAPAAARRKGAARGGRKGKRKAAEVGADGDESSSGLEDAGVGEAGDEDGRELVTPEPSGAETESDSEDDEEQPPPRKAGGRSTGAKSKTVEAQGKGSGEKNQKNETPPPRRDLPFLRNPPRGPKGFDAMDIDPPDPAPVAQDDDETDDEL